MGSEQEFPALIVGERSSVSDGSVSTSLVDLSHSLIVVCWWFAGSGRICSGYHISSSEDATPAERPTFDVEGILHLSSRMLLRHEHGVEVPESGLDKLVSGHFGESGNTGNC